MLTSSSYDTRQAELFFANKNAFTTGPVEVSHRIEHLEDMVIVDVREAEDYRKGHVPGAINLPESQWATYQGLSKEVPNIIYCYAHTCHLAARACQQFARAGYEVMEMDGGWAEWEENDLEVEK